MEAVEGYRFTDLEMAKKAQKEAEGVRYIKERVNWNNPEKVLAIYRSMIEKDMFETPVGLAFLSEVRGKLMEEAIIDKEQIPEIPVGLYLKKQEPLRNNQKKGTSGEKKASDYGSNSSLRRKYRVACFFAIVFGIVIIGMFAINLVSTNNVTIFNYENKIIDKYEAWEKELEQREEALMQQNP